MSGSFESMPPGREQPSPPLGFDQARQVLYTAGDIALGNGEHHSEQVRAHIGEHLGRMIGSIDSAEADSAQIMGAFPEGETPSVTIDRILDGPRARRDEILKEQGVAQESHLNPFLNRDEEHLALTALEQYVLAAHREIK
jgi:hypothetical protein